MLVLRKSEGVGVPRSLVKFKEDSSLKHINYVSYPKRIEKGFVWRRFSFPQETSSENIDSLSIVGEWGWRWDRGEEVGGETFTLGLSFWIYRVGRPAKSLKPTKNWSIWRRTILNGGRSLFLSLPSSLSLLLFDPQGACPVKIRGTTLYISVVHQSQII